MFCICFVKTNSEKSISDSIIKMLSKVYNIFVIDKELSFQKGIGEPLVFFDSRFIKEITSEKILIVFDEGSELSLPDISFENAAAIVNSADRNLISQLAKYDIPVIACGDSQKDTFTFSSITEDEAVVSLQRTITSFLGKVIEPFEIPVKLYEKDNVFCALCYVAILTIFDDNERNSL